MVCNAFAIAENELLMADGSDLEPGGGEDEHDLVAARHDPEAFVAFYDRSYSRVAAFFYRRILCPFTTAELTAETYARVWSTRDRFDPAKGSAVGWTMGIATNLYRQWSHKGHVEELARKRLSVATPDLVLEDLERIENLVDLSDYSSLLHEALDQLSPALKDAVVLRVAMDLPYDEVAAHLDCTVGAARVRVSRALDTLLRAMGVDG
jgi:RNA polymerase sigma-70 factor (ECF subfamily)